MKIMMELNRDDIDKLQYPIIVEMWDRVMGSMSSRRKYREAFSEAERATLSRYHNTFYAWHLRTGTPDKVVMSVPTLALLQRAINFFGTL